MEAAVKGIREAGLGDAVRWVEPRPATVEELALVHESRYVEALRRFCERGGGSLNADTADAGTTSSAPSACERATSPS